MWMLKLRGLNLFFAIFCWQLLTSPIAFAEEWELSQTSGGAWYISIVSEDSDKSLLGYVCPRSPKNCYIMLTFLDHSKNWKSGKPIQFRFDSEELNWDQSLTANAYDTLEQAGKITVKLKFNLKAERPEHVVPQVGAFIIYSREILVGIPKSDRTELLRFSGNGASDAMHELMNKFNR